MNSVQIWEQFNGTEPIFGIASEAGVLKSTPELSVFNAVTVPQTSFKTLKAVNVNGAKFRNVGEFIPDAEITLAQQTVNTAYLDAHWYIDIATGTNDWGESKTVETITKLKLKDAFLHFAKQIYNGVNNDPQGFPGLKSIIESNQSVAGQSSPMIEVSSQSMGGVYTDIYFVATGLTETSIVWGNGGTITAGAIQQGRAVNGTNSQVQMWQDIHAQAGLSVASAASVGMLKNVALGKEVPDLTDAIGWKLRSMFASGVNISAVFMNPQALYELQVSRNFTNIVGGISGAGGTTSNLYFPDSPTTFAGIPVYITDAIGSYQLS